MLPRMRSLVLALAGLVIAASSVSLFAQIHGVPASVTSFGFGGSHSFTPGVAASVTSLGPRGFGGGHARFGNCCSNVFSHNGTHSGALVGRHRFRHNFFGGVPVYGVPYSEVVVGPEDDEEDYDGGPTIFDRRGSYNTRTREVIVNSRPAADPPATAAAEPPAPVVAQPSTVLVFRDGHQSELQNYAIVGDTIFDLAENRSHKIQIADLDLPATRKANDERGVDFQIPGKAE